MLAFSAQGTIPETDWLVFCDQASAAFIHLSEFNERKILKTKRKN